MVPSSMSLQINEASSQALQSSRCPAPFPVTPRSFYRFGVDSCGITDLAYYSLRREIIRRTCLSTEVPVSHHDGCGANTSDACFEYLPRCTTRD